MIERRMFRAQASGQLVAISALHVGSSGDGLVVDMEQSRDGRGQLIIPGTTITGALRAALEQWQGTPGTDWWGRLERASTITIDDAVATEPVRLAVRDSVSIDRISGAAAYGQLFSRDVVSAGTRFSFGLTINSPDRATSESLMKRIVGVLQGPGIWLGAATTGGLGHVRLENASPRLLDFTSPSGLRAAVLGGGHPIDIAVIDHAGPRPGHLRITIPWRPVGPVMSRVSVKGATTDSFPLHATDSQGSVRLLLPGSSIKGSLRSHAEYIVRTVVNRDAPLDFRSQMRAEGLSGIGELFGLAGEKQKSTGEKQKSTNSGRRGALTVHDTLTSVQLPSREWNALRVAEGSDEPGAQNQEEHKRFATAIDNLNTKVAGQGLWFDFAVRNAVDRWSGGAAELFAAVEPYAARVGVWDPIVVELDVARLLRAKATVDTALALLLLVLRDLVQGGVPIGFGTTRGLGSISVSAEDVRFDAGDDVAARSATVGRLRGRTLADIGADEKLLIDLTEVWQSTTNQENGATTNQENGAT